MREVNVGLLGCGVVGSALAELIHDEADAIAESAGVRLKIIKALVRDPSKDRNGLKGKLSLTKELDEVCGHKELDILVELLGGADVALTAIRKGLRAGKSVVTANKLALSLHGPELLKLAHQSNCSLAYEAAVGSCIPVLQSLDHNLASERFHGISGILNGTTNFILSRMASEGLDYEAAVFLAQQRGLAEADPTADVSGSDARHKLVILSRKAFGLAIKSSDIPTAGIEDVSSDDLVFAKHFGYTIKLLALAQRHGPSLSLRVGPHLVPDTSPFSAIKDESNAVLLEGERVGRLFFAGPGAGPHPTARAVLGDILSIATGERACVPGRRQLDLPRPDLIPPADPISRYYLRVTFDDQPHVLANVTKTLDASNVGVHRVEARGDGRGDIVILTHEARAGDVRQAVARLKRLRVLRETPRAFPIYQDQPAIQGVSK